MGIRILPPASKKEQKARLRMLADLRQQGMQVGGLAQTFWTLAVGLELCNSELSKIFNECLDNPLPPFEMEGLKTLDFWSFINYLSYRSLVMSCRSEPTAVLPKMPESTITSPEDSEASLSLTRRRRSRRRAVKSALVVSSPVVLEDPTPVVSSPVVLEDLTPVVSSPVVLEDLTPVVSSPVVLEDPTPVVLSLGVLEDPMWVVPEIATETSLVMEWLESTPEPAPVREPSESTPESAPVREPSETTPELAPVQEPSESTPEPAPVQESPEPTQVFESIPELVPDQESSEPTQVYEFTPEPTRIYESIPELVPVREFTPGPAPVPPRVAASAAEPPGAAVSASAPLWVVAPTPELSVCPVTAKETVVLSACPVLVKETIAELSVHPVAAVEAVIKLFVLLFAVMMVSFGGLLVVLVCVAIAVSCFAHMDCFLDSENKTANGSFCVSIP